MFFGLSLPTPLFIRKNKGLRWKKHTIELMLSRVRTFNLSAFHSMQLKAGWKPSSKAKRERKSKLNALRHKSGMHWKWNALTGRKEHFFRTSPSAFYPKVDSIKKATNGMTNCIHRTHPPPHGPLLIENAFAGAALQLEPFAKFMLHTLRRRLLI